MPDNTVSLKNNAEKCILIDASSLFQNRLMNDHSFERKSHAAKPAALSTSSKKSADPIYDPYLIKQISEYLISVNKPWAYRLNAIWCLGITTGCRISALVRKGKKGKASDPDDDYTPLFIRDIMDTPDTFKERITLHERKVKKMFGPILTKMATDAISLYLSKCRKGFSLDEPLFIGQKSKTEAIEEGTVNRDFARVKKALNIRTAFTTHTMRKTFAHYAAPVISKLRLEGIVFIDPHTLDIIRVSTCHYDNSLTKQYAGWDIPTSDAVRNELSHFYENPSIIPQVERLLALASQHKSHLNFSRED